MDGYDSPLVWIGVGVLIHIVLASFETHELGWKVHLSKKQYVLGILIIWMIPVFGVFIARNAFDLKKCKGDTSSHGDNSNQNLFEHNGGE